MFPSESFRDRTDRCAIAYLWFSIDSLINRSWLLALMLSMSGPAFAFSQGVFVQKLVVQQESQLDWKYAAGQNGINASTERMEKYSSRKQLYDLFGPPGPPSRELPLILFISPGNVPREWEQFAHTCRKHGVLFAGVRNAGNAQDLAVRVRAAVDVFDDVRRRYHVDPDRTYVAGFSGGATVATRLAFALPECFGGLICIGQRVFPPRTDALIDRAGERIHIAALCGAKELVGPEVEHLDQLVCRAYGFHCRCFVSRRAGHRMPKEKVIEAAFNWLEGGVEERKELAEKYVATRLDARKEYNASSWRNLLVEEAEDRWAAKEYASAVALLQWIETRWPDSEAAKQAAAKSGRLAQQSEFIEDKSRTTGERKTILDEALVTGYEKLANDRRIWFTRERRSRYAKIAIRLIETSGIELKEQSERIEKLREIAARGKQ